MISLFGHYFISLDYDPKHDRLYGFETFRDVENFVDLIAALPDNTRSFFYVAKKNRLVSLTRKIVGENKIHEYYNEFKLKSTFLSLSELVSNNNIVFSLQEIFNALEKEKYQLNSFD